MGAFPPVPKSAIPAGPTGILDSGRTGKKSGGKKTLGGKTGLRNTPFTKRMGKR